MANERIYDETTGQLYSLQPSQLLIVPLTFTGHGAEEPLNHCGATLAVQTWEPNGVKNKLRSAIGVTQSLRENVILPDETCYVHPNARAYLKHLKQYTVMAAVHRYHSSILLFKYQLRNK